MMIAPLKPENDAVYKDKKLVDVICQHARDGKIYPIKVKIQDEDGEYQIYRILRFRELVTDGVHVLPNGAPSGSHIWSYECIINVFGAERRIYLIYYILDGVWSCQMGKKN